MTKSLLLLGYLFFSLITFAAPVEAEIPDVSKWDCTEGWRDPQDHYGPVYASKDLPDYALVARRCITENQKRGFYIQEAGEVIALAIFDRLPKDPNERIETFGAIKTNMGAWKTIVNQNPLVLKPFILYERAEHIVLELIRDNLYAPVAERVVTRKTELKFVVPRDFNKFKPTKTCSNNELFAQGYDDKNNNQGIVVISKNSNDVFMIIFRSKPIAKAFFQKQNDGSWRRISKLPQEITEFILLKCADQRKPHYH